MSTPALTPSLDVQLEADEFRRTFAQYERLTSATPGQAVEKQAVNLRIQLIRGFKKVAIKRSTPADEMKARGGTLKVRRSIRDKYKNTDAFLGGMINRGGKDRAMSKRRKGKTSNKPVPAWAVAVNQEIAARRRSRSLLAASWLSPMQASNTPRIATFTNRLKSGTVAGTVAVDSTGKDANATLTNQVEGVAKVGYSRGIIAAALRAASADMMVYINRKLERNKRETLPNS